ncbi:unnamed protein product [Lampetra planeri]
MPRSVRLRPRANATLMVPSLSAVSSHCELVFDAGALCAEVKQLEEFKEVKRSKERLEKGLSPHGGTVLADPLSGDGERKSLGAAK